MENTTALTNPPTIESELGDEEPDLPVYKITDCKLDSQSKRNLGHSQSSGEEEALEVSGEDKIE